MAVRVVWDPNETDYEEAARRLPGSSIYQAYSWGEIRAHQGLRPHRVVVMDDAGREPLAAATWLCRRLPLGRAVWMAPRGPLWHARHPEALACLLAASEERAREERTVACRMMPAVTATPDVLRLLGDLGLRRVWWKRRTFGGILPVREWHVNLDRGLTHVWQGLDGDARRLIRRASEHGVVVEPTDASTLRVLWRWLDALAARKGFRLRAEPVRTEMARTWLARGEGVLLVARRGGVPVAASLSTHWGEQAVGHFLADDGTGRTHGVVQALYWAFLVWAHGRGAKVANLGGVAARPDRPGSAQGLEAFKRHFGGGPVTYVGEWDRPIEMSTYGLWRTMERAWLECGLPTGLPPFRARSVVG